MIKRLGLRSSEILMTGDNRYNDVIGPKRLSIHAVHLVRSGSSDNAISSLNEIFQYV